MWLSHALVFHMPKPDSNLKIFCFSVNYNFIFVMPEQKWYFCQTFYSQVIVLNVFLKKFFLYTTVVIRGLYLWYNSSSMRYILSNKPVKAFHEYQTSKDKPTPLFTIKIWNFHTILMQPLVIFLTHSHLFLYSIFSTSVTASY